jgi:hypothetical protein
MTKKKPELVFKVEYKPGDLLTENQALAICEELWTWLKDTGNHNKDRWPGWTHYGQMTNACPLCQYEESSSSATCKACPITWSKSWKRIFEISTSEFFVAPCASYEDSPFLIWCRTIDGFSPDISSEAAGKAAGKVLALVRRTIAKNARKENTNA